MRQEFVERSYKSDNNSDYVFDLTKNENNSENVNSSFISKDSSDVLHSKYNEFVLSQIESVVLVRLYIAM